MTTLAKLSAGIGAALHVPLDEVEHVAGRQREAGLIAAEGAPKRGLGTADAARLLVGVMVMRIEGAATPAAAVAWPAGSKPARPKRSRRTISTTPHRPTICSPSSTPRRWCAGSRCGR